MTDVNYFPVIAMDPDGRYRAAMLPTHDEASAKDSHKAYLEEIVPHSFRLHSREHIPKTVNISCPYCGAYLKCLYEGDGRRILSMYRCPKCR
jgi:predicted RNA-binding Zn-ribbon protein involved in translation (DUF1610 family)